VIHLFQEARAVQAELAGRAWPFCFIGGIALQHWGDARVTRDLDLSLFTGFGGEAPVVDALLGRFEGRIPDARDFALTHRVVLLRSPGGVEVDVALAALPFERELIARAVDAEFGPGVLLHICSAEDLLILKAFADRPQDRADLIGIARRRGRVLDWIAVLERLAPFAEAKDAPHILDRVRDLRREFGS